MATAGDFSACLPGGMGEKHPSTPVDYKQMEAGRKVELEHTDKPQVAAEIAADHLAEIPDYYSRLGKMEAEAEQEGQKIAEGMADLPPELVPLATEHRKAEQEYIENANKEIQSTALKGHAVAALGDTAVNALPGMSKMIAMSGGSSLADATQDRVEALHQRHAEGLEALKAKHRAELELAARQIRSPRRLAKTAAMGAIQRGDQPTVPAPPVPGNTDPVTSDKYHDGYAYAQARGVAGLNQVTTTDIQTWQKHAPEWRTGFADACDRLGLKRIGDMLRQPKLAALLNMSTIPEGAKTAALGSTLGTIGGILGGAALGHAIGPVAGHMIAEGSPQFDANLAEAGTEFGAGFGALGGNRLGHVADVATGLAPVEKRPMVPQFSAMDMSPHTAMV